jgi:hypothetical protein
VNRAGFLLAEDEAIKLRLSNLTISDDRNVARPVKVFFRYPDGETERQYPFITIDLLDINHAKNRQHSDVTLYTGLNNNHPNVIKYWPNTSSASTPIMDDDDFYRTNEFIPIDLMYQVATYCRSALHDRELTSQMLSSVVPFRYNSINIGVDGTSRRLDLLDWSAADMLDPEAGYRKRIFRKIYTLQMSSELPTSTLLGLKKVLSVSTTLEQTN